VLLAVARSLFASPDHKLTLSCFAPADHDTQETKPRDETCASLIRRGCKTLVENFPINAVPKGFMGRPTLQLEKTGRTAGSGGFGWRVGYRSDMVRRKHRSFVGASELIYNSW
jgi:hypothetical protein